MGGGQAIVAIGMSLGYMFKMQDNFLPRLCERFSALQILNAICLFYIFKNMEIKSSKAINIIASGTLGVYLIHENNYFKFFLWNKILNLYNAFFENYFLLWYIFDVLAVFMVCDVLEITRNYIFNKIAFHSSKMIDKQLKRIDDFING